jgi:hypothetical protein
VTAVVNPPVTTAKGVFNVTVRADVNVEPTADDFTLKELLRKRRSLGFIRPDDSTSAGPLSKIVHDAYFWGIQLAHRRYSFQDADIDFMNTAAHEFGHRILDSYGGWDYSWEHKGTSGKWIQQPNSGTSYPASGEIDLMKYAENRVPAHDEWDRSVASEQDVKGLLWLTRVEFFGSK